MNLWIHCLVAIMAILSVRVASADKGAGIGYVLYKALTRPSDSPSRAILMCPQFTRRNDLYTFDLRPQGTVAVFSKVEKSGACIPEKWETFAEKFPCLTDSVTRALHQASQWNERAGMDATRVIVVATDPRVTVAPSGLGARISRLTQSLKVTSSACRFKVEIRTGSGLGTKILAEENLDSGSDLQ